MTEEQLAEIEGRMNAPMMRLWRDVLVDKIVSKIVSEVTTHYYVVGNLICVLTPAEKALIARAPTDIAVLLAEVRRLKAEVDSLVEVKAYEAAHGGRSFTFRRGPNIFSWSGATAQEAWANAGKPSDEFGSWSWYEIGHEEEP